MNPDDPEYLRACVSINETALVAEYARIPGDLAYWGQQLADAELDYQVAKARLDATTATATLAAIKSGLKPKMLVESAVTLNELVRADGEALIAADARRRRIRATLDAIRVKADMLVSLGATMRAEMRGGL